MISTKYKFTFIHKPKTGGNSIHVFFEKCSDLKVIKGQRNANKGSIQYLGYNKHHTCKMRIDYMKNKKMNPDDYIFLITIRNPFDLVLSWYYYKHRNKWNSLNFTNYLKTLNQEWVDYNYDDQCNNKEEVNMRIIRFENIEVDCRSFADEIGFKNPGAFPKWNVSKQKEVNGHYRKHYNDEQRKIVEELFAEVLEKFDYSF